jgi:hypothetical protein
MVTLAIREGAYMLDDNYPDRSASTILAGAQRFAVYVGRFRMR